MPATILSDNGASSGTAGLKTSGSNDGILELQTTTAGGTATTAVSINTTQQVAVTAGTAAAPSIIPSGDTNTGIFFPAADTIAFSEGGTESRRIDSSGQVAIGTTTANDTLTVGGNNAFIRIDRTANEPGIDMRVGGSSTNRGVIAVTTGGAMYFTSGGSTSRAIILSDGKFLVGKTSNENEKNNPFAINLYLLAYDSNNNITNINRAVKENLKTYLNEYKILTDGVNMLDGFVINIGVDFEIICYPNYNKSEILIQCITSLKEYFLIDNMTFNQTINLSEIELMLANIEGVSSVPMLKITNKCGGKYAPHSYNIDAATKDKIVYPSLDPSVFEIKFPDSDIKGRVR